MLRDVTAARERDQARDAFIGMLSHELRTPITTIYAGAKLLARGDAHLADETRFGIFEDIHGEAEHLHRLVEDVVALTRFGEGALDIGSEPVLLQRVLPAVARSEQGRWPGGTFDLSLEPDLPPVAADATYVEQVVRNLLANAMKYGGPGAHAVIEATERGREVLVRVLDEGPGFPQEEADQLFQLYYRSPSQARKVSGSGIGLFVCSRLIEAMGGRVWASNRPTGARSSASPCGPWPRIADPRERGRERARPPRIPRRPRPPSLAAQADQDGRGDRHDRQARFDGLHRGTGPPDRHLSWGLGRTGRLDHDQEGSAGR